MSILGIGASIVSEKPWGKASKPFALSSQGRRTCRLRIGKMSALGFYGLGFMFGDLLVEAAQAGLPGRMCVLSALETLTHKAESLNPKP